MKRKIIATLLTLCMIFSILPVAAFAATYSQPDGLTDYRVEGAGVVKGKELPKNMTCAEDKKEKDYIFVQLNKDVPSGHTLMVAVFGAADSRSPWMIAYSEAPETGSVYFPVSQMNQWYWKADENPDNHNSETLEPFGNPENLYINANIIATDSIASNEFLPHNSVTTTEAVADVLKLVTVPVAEPIMPPTSDDPALDLAAIAAAITTAPLHDTADEIADADLYTAGSYKATGTVASSNINVAVVAEQLQKHSNAQSPAVAAYWVGVKYPAVQNWTITEYQRTGADKVPITGELEDDGSLNAYYKADTETSYTVTVTYKNTKDNTTTQTVTFNVDLTGVHKKGESSVPTLTVAPSTATGTELLGKSAADLQSDVTVDGHKVSGISKYVTGYTGFSSVVDEQAGNYIALVLTSSDGKPVWVQSSDGKTWTKVAPAPDDDSTIVLRLNKYAENDKLITVAISDETPVEATEKLTLDLTGVTLAKAPAVVDKLTVEGIGFEAVPADAQAAMADLSSVVPISDIDVNTMFVRFNGMDAEKTYKVVFTNADNETVYDSLQTDGNQNSVITGRTAVTVYFTFNKDGGSHTLKDIASGTYTATLYEKTGDTWTALTEFDGDNTISLNSLTIKKTAADAGTKTFYKTGTVVEAPTAAAAEVTVPDHYKFTGWTDGTDTYQAGGNVTVSKDITLTAGTELGAITELTAAAPKATLVAEVKSGAIVISGLVTEGTDTVTVTYVLDTCPAEETHTATVTLVAGQEDGFTTDSKVTIFGTEYTVDVSGIIVSAQIVNAGSEVEVSDSVAQEHQETVAAAAQNTTIAHEEMVALVADNAKEVSAAAAAVTSEQKAAAAEALNALDGISGVTPENVVTVVQPIMQVTAEAYDPDAKELKMDISAGYRLVAVTQGVLDEGTVLTEGVGANAVVIPGSAKTMTVSAPVTVSVELPAAIAGTNETIAVLHEKNGNHYHQADIVRSGDDPNYVYTATFTSDDGLSPFTFKAATLVAKIGDTYYETLQDAVNAVANGGIITLINNIPADHVATVSGSTSKTFTIAVSGKAFVAGNTSPAAVDNEDGTYTVTYTYSGGGSGGSSGGSSNKPTTPTKPTNPTQFVDVPAGAYYTDAVKWAVEKGITTGMTDTTFAPNADCTRAQMVTFLWRAAGSPKAEGENPFTDVAAGAYYYDAVLWAVSKGITKGTSDTTFTPDDIVSRAQTVTFLHRYAGAPEASGNSFTDVTAGSYYEGAVDWAVAEGVTQGTSDTTFSPDADCVRAQIVTFLYRYMVK